MSPGKISNMGKGSSQSSETKSPSGASSCSIPEEDSTIIPEYSFATIRSKISYFLSFQDAEIQEDFLIYCTKRRSIHFLLFAVFLITFAITPITIAIVIDDGTYLDTNDDQSLGKLICSIVACLFLIIAVITGWKSIQDILKPDKKVVPLNEHSTRSISTKRISSNMASLSSISMDQQSSKKSTVTKLPSDIHSKAHESKMQSSISIQSFIQNIYLSSLLSYPQIHLISIILHFLILFLRSLLWQSCTFHSKTLSNFVGCGYSLEEVGPHLDTALGLYLSRAALAIMTLPLFYFINLPEIPWTTIVGSTTSIFILAIVGLSLDLESSWSIPMTTMWYLILLAVNTDLHLRNIMNFFTQKALLRLLNENDTVFANEYSNEMRSMIGNVAHDLKTVSEILPSLFLYVCMYVVSSRYPFFVLGFIR